jgi:hypothetical protein
VALARTVDAIGPVQAGVEPLRGVRRHLLGRQHVAQFVVERLGVFLAVEVAALPAPVGPGAGQAVEHLTAVDLGAVALVFRQLLQGLLVGLLAPQPGRNGVFLDRLQLGRHAGLAEILLGENVGATWENCAGT